MNYKGCENLFSRLRNKKGFTLLELVVAMGFFAVMSMGVMSLLLQNMKLMSYTETQASAMTIAFNKWVQLLSTPYDNVSNQARTALGDGHDLQIDASEQTLADNSKQKNVKITVFKTGGNSIYSLNEIKSQVNGGDGTPKGMAGYFALSSCPAGWTAADGNNGTVDLRGVFPRGLDNGRGLDSGRTISTYQSDAIRNIKGNIGPIQYVSAGLQKQSGAFYTSSAYGWGQSAFSSYDFTTNVGNGYYPLLFDASLSVPTANENRPVNVALLACQKQ